MSEQNWEKCNCCQKVKAGYYKVEGKPVCHKCFILGKMMGSRKVED